MSDYESEITKIIRVQTEHAVQRIVSDSQTQQELLDILGTIIAKVNMVFSEGTYKLAAAISRRNVEMDQINMDQNAELQSLEPLFGKFANQERVQDLQNKLREQNELLGKLDRQRNEVNVFDKSYQDEIREVVSLYESMHKEYRRLSDTFKDYTGISDDLSMTVELMFDVDDFDEKFSGLLNRRKKLDTVFDNGFQGDEFIFKDTEHGSIIEYMLQQILDEKITTKANVDQDNLLAMLLGDYFEIHFDLIYKNDSMTKMSPGKRGLVLLQLLLHLSNSKHPILIDQPEDNLDNRTISAELQEFIKEKKVQRQILMVTHNANLAVLADAEEVVVANQSGQQLHKDNDKYRFEYASGALECSFMNVDAPGILQRFGIRQHVCDILEGGTEAFMKREQKYGL